MLKTKCYIDPSVLHKYTFIVSFVDYENVFYECMGLNGLRTHSPKYSREQIEFIFGFYTALHSLNTNNESEKF